MFFLCGFAYTDTSYLISVTELNSNKIFDALDDTQYSFALYNSDYYVFRYTHKELN